MTDSKDIDFVTFCVTASIQCVNIYLCLKGIEQNFKLCHVF